MFSKLNFIVIGISLMMLAALLTTLPATNTTTMATTARAPKTEMAAVAETAAVTETAILYDGSLGNLPGDQGFTYTTFPAGPTQTFEDGGVILDTTATTAYYAGYFGRPALIPRLDRTSSFTVTFTLQLEAESHNNDDRAGFSIIVLSDDAGGSEIVQGIELGFWSGEIWAQDDGTQGGTLFTHAEGVAVSTLTTTLYHLAVQTDTYTLWATNETPLLTGRLRNYTAFSGFPDPYETPNFLFLGDDTSSAAARFKLDYVDITVPAAGPGKDRFLYLPLVQYRTIGKNPQQ